MCLLKEFYLFSFTKNRNMPLVFLKNGIKSRFSLVFYGGWWTDGVTLWKDGSCRQCRRDLWYHVSGPEQRCHFFLNFFYNLKEWAIKSWKVHLEISYVCSVFFGEVTNLKYEMSRSHYIQIFCVCVWTFWKEQTIFKISKKPTTVYNFANLLDN